MPVIFFLPIAATVATDQKSCNFSTSSPGRRICSERTSSKIDLTRSNYDETEQSNPVAKMQDILYFCKNAPLSHDCSLVVRLGHSIRTIIRTTHFNCKPNFRGQLTLNLPIWVSLTSQMQYCPPNVEKNLSGLFNNHCRLMCQIPCIWNWLNRIYITNVYLIVFM